MKRGRLRNDGDGCYHVTHRCQEQRYLLRFKRDRRNYLDRLQEAVTRISIDVLDYMVTSNHVHLLIWAGEGNSVSQVMQYVQGTTARDFNLRKRRSGAYWANRYHPTLVQKGTHLSRCLFYLGLNMVRAGAVSVPAEWETCGYHELAGFGAGRRIINVKRLMRCLGKGQDIAAFRVWYRTTMEEACTRYLVREPWWTEAAAVGEKFWVEKLRDRIVTGRRRIEPIPVPEDQEVREADAGWMLRASRRSGDAFLSGA